MTPAARPTATASRPRTLRVRPRRERPSSSVPRSRSVSVARAARRAGPQPPRSTEPATTRAVQARSAGSQRATVPGIATSCSMSSGIMSALTGPPARPPTREPSAATTTSWPSSSARRPPGRMPRARHSPWSRRRWVRASPAVETRTAAAARTTRAMMKPDMSRAAWSMSVDRGTPRGVTPVAFAAESSAPCRILSWPDTQAPATRVITQVHAHVPAWRRRSASSRRSISAHLRPVRSARRRTRRPGPRRAAVRRCARRP